MQLSKCVSGVQASDACSDDDAIEIRTLHVVFYTNKTTPKHHECSRRSREVVRDGLSGQRTNHNAHTQSTIPGYCITGLARATRQRQGHNGATRSCTKNQVLSRKFLTSARPRSVRCIALRFLRVACTALLLLLLVACLALPMQLVLPQISCFAVFTRAVLARRLVGPSVSLMRFQLAQHG